MTVHKRQVPNSPIGWSVWISVVNEFLMTRIKPFFLIMISCCFSVSCAQNANDLSLSCEGIEYDSSDKSFTRSTRTLHIRNRMFEGSECETWGQDKIVCHNGTSQSLPGLTPDLCLSNAADGYCLKIDRVSGETQHETWLTIRGKKITTKFSGNCKKIEGRKF